MTKGKLCNIISFQMEVTKMKNQYNKTITACFTGYIVQAVVNNFAPLLFLFSAIPNLPRMSSITGLKGN